MFINVKTKKQWYVIPIIGKTTFKVVEVKIQVMRHVTDKWNIKEEPISKKTVLTDKPLNVAERFAFLKEHHKI